MRIPLTGRPTPHDGSHRKACSQHGLPSRTVKSSATSVFVRGASRTMRLCGQRLSECRAKNSPRSLASSFRTTIVAWGSEKRFSTMLATMLRRAVSVLRSRWSRPTAQLSVSMNAVGGRASQLSRGQRPTRVRTCSITCHRVVEQEAFLRYDRGRSRSASLAVMAPARRHPDFNSHDPGSHSGGPP